MVTYAVFDAELNRWATQVGLMWATKYKEDEVRSLDIDIGHGLKAQIWIEVASDNSSIDVKAWDRKKRTFSETTTPSQLQATLDRAMAQVNAWKNNGLVA